MVQYNDSAMFWVKNCPTSSKISDDCGCIDAVEDENNDDDDDNGDAVDDGGRPPAYLIFVTGATGIPV